MTPHEFFRKVERMRSKQKEYFRTRSSAALTDSKRLEREIDEEIERVNKILSSRQNPSLNFNDLFEPYGYDKAGKPKKHTYRGKEVRAFRAQFADDLLRPVFDWSAQQVIDYILDAGLEPNPLYRMAYKRVGCWPCVMANQRDILNIARQAPERIDYIAKIEQELQCGDRLRSEFFGPDKIPAHAITKRILPCFETEAYNYEDDPDYLKRRIPFWGWISCIPNRKVKHKR